MLKQDAITRILTSCSFVDFVPCLIVPVVEQPKAPEYKSNSSSWATVREGEPEPSRESVLKRNVVPEWDDVENEDERPSIAGIGKVRACSNELRLSHATSSLNAKPKSLFVVVTSCGDRVQCTP